MRSLVHGRDYPIAAYGATALDQCAIHGGRYPVLLPSTFAFNDGPFVTAEWAGCCFVAHQQPAAPVYTPTCLAGDTDGTGGGLVAVESLAFAKDVHTLAHGSTLPKRVEART
jgi:hypothetical protein